MNSLGSELLDIHPACSRAIWATPCGSPPSGILRGQLLGSADQLLDCSGIAAGILSSPRRSRCARGSVGVACPRRPPHQYPLLSLRRQPVLEDPPPRPLLKGQRPNDAFHVHDSRDRLRIELGPVEGERRTPILAHQNSVSWTSSRFSSASTHRRFSSNVYASGPLSSSLCESPSPMSSGAMHRPHPTTCGTTSRQRYGDVGWPWRRTMGAPLPASTYAMRCPRTSSHRFVHVPTAVIRSSWLPSRSWVPECDGPRHFVSPLGSAASWSYAPPRTLGDLPAGPSLLLGLVTLPTPPSVDQDGLITQPSDMIRGVKRSSVTHLTCSVARGLEVIGEWWTLPRGSGPLPWDAEVR